MKQVSFLLWVVLVSTTEICAGVLADSTAKNMFLKLTEQIGLKDPELKADEHEIRIWNRQALRYGDAQMVYVLRKTKKRFTVLKYIINSDKQGFRFAERLKPTVAITPVLWNRLVKNNILILPDHSVIFKRPYMEPELPKDTIKAGMQADGSFTVKGRRTLRRHDIIADGEGYTFELFSADGHRVYGYGNPYDYLRNEPRSEELRNIVDILGDLSLVFRSDKSGRDRGKAINED